MPSKLPQPSAAQIDRSAVLMQQIKTQVERNNGWLPFDVYMNAALYTPELGYYTNEGSPFSAFAAKGDFITAPLLSPLFGACIAEQAIEVFERIGAFNILEIGAGTGRLAADICAHLSACGVTVNYSILELSGTLRAQQQSTIRDAMANNKDNTKPHQIEWLDALPTDYIGFIIGNEVLDAMPVKLIGVQNGEWFERGIVVENNRLAYQNHATDKRLPMPAKWLDALEQSGATYLSETHHQQIAFIESLGACLKRGAVMMIDYGFPAHEFYHPQRNTGTLMCHIQHVAHDDALYFAGVQDITAHVNFSALNFCQNDLKPQGYVNQANFLINTGLLDFLAQMPRDDNDTAARAAANRAHKLISEAEMGELFKVMVWIKNMPMDEYETLIGFGRGDRLDSL